MFAVPDNTVSLPGHPTDPHPVHVATRYAAHPEWWSHRLRWDPAERTAELLADEGTHQVWLLTWLPGQHADMHDHGGATGAFTVLRGELSERVWRADGVHTHHLRPGQTRVFGPGYTHRVAALSAAASLHVYRPLRTIRTLHEVPFG